jgi:hypothetical protein
MFKLVPCTQQRQQLASTDAILEIHLVAMPVSQSHLENGGEHACFWGVLVGEEAMYASCLALLNLRCLAMVLDLDETLIVANTMKTFDVLNRCCCCSDYALCSFPLMKTWSVLSSWHRFNAEEDESS